MFKTARIVGIIATTALTAGLGFAGAQTANATPNNPLGTATTPALAIRSAPSTHAKLEGRLTEGYAGLVCKVRGTTVGGNDVWYLGDFGQTPMWLSASYISNQSPVPWCASSKAVGRTTTALTKRAGPTTSDKGAGSLHRGQRVNLVCKVESQGIRGNKLWYQTSDRQWISARYVDNVGQAPKYCTGAYS